MTKFSRLILRLQLLLLFLLPVRAAAQQDFYESVFTLAVELERSGATKQAATEYKRYLFLQDFSEGIHQVQSCLALSDYYRREQKQELSLDYLRRAKNLCLTKPEYSQLLTQLQIKETRLLLEIASEKKQSLESEPVIFAYSHLTDYAQPVRENALITLLQNNLQNGDLGSFTQNFDLLNQLSPGLFSASQAQVINDSLLQHQAFKPKSLKLAGWLSIIPGLGQLYAHDFKDALNAFLLDGALIGLSVFSLVNLQFWDFSLLEFDPLLRFYRGNLYNAQRDAHKFNQKKYAQIAAPIQEILEQTKDSLYERYF